MDAPSRSSLLGLELSGSVSSVALRNLDSGEVHEQQVGPGDTIYTPPDVVEHQLLNNGSETIRMAVVGVPPSRRTPLG